MTTRAPLLNAILGGLPASDYRRLMPFLEQVDLEFGQVLHRQDAKIAHVYFPQDCLVSFLTHVDDHSALEVGLVGGEGMAGVAAALGADSTPFRAVVQGAGTAMRMTAPAFRRQMAASAALRSQVHLYAHSLMAQIARTAACNRFHVVEQRLSRWLLMMRERVGSNDFRLTHEFLGKMLGVRRAGVTSAANLLRKRGLIAYRRGDISILDPRRLAALACSCYRKTPVRTRRLAPYVR
jgi:CRP-like cAMP-binding protein